MPALEETRRWLNTTTGRLTAGVLLCAAAVAVFVSARGLLSDAGAGAANDRTFICAETGKSFAYELERGDVVPVRSPHSGRNTGYPSEPCYWTKDGQAKPEPTAVLLEEYRGNKGPTFCPDCGRRVVGHNPAPVAGAKPPPTREEYAAAASDPARRASAREGARSPDR